MSKEKITFQLYKKSKYENENLKQFELRPSEESYIYFGGFGTTWTEENLKTYVSGIDSLLILEKEDTLRLNDQNSIYKYFKNRRRGPFKDEILIKIK